jgi:ribosomal protein S18 acetylase RimI-like enzyme
VSRSLHIRKAQLPDSAAIADVHGRQIEWGLLSAMGREFVVAFYRTLIGSRWGFAFVAEQDGRVIGFASGVVSWRRFYMEFLRRNLRLAVRVLLAGLRGRRWRRLLETTRYASSGALPSAELVSIALEPEARGADVGGALARRVLEEFAARAVRAVRVTAGAGNAPANRLYERVGFTLHSRAEIHPGETAAVYVITLNGQRHPVPS